MSRPKRSPEEAGFRLFDGVSRFLGCLRETRTPLLILDDLQAADESSLKLLGLVTRDVAGRR